MLEHKSDENLRGRMNVETSRTLELKIASRIRGSTDEDGVQHGLRVQNTTILSGLGFSES